MEDLLISVTGAAAVKIMRCVHPLSWTLWGQPVIINDCCKPLNPQTSSFGPLFISVSVAISCIFMLKLIKISRMLAIIGYYLLQEILLSQQKNYIMNSCIFFYVILNIMLYYIMLYISPRKLPYIKTHQKKTIYLFKGIVHQKFRFFFWKS